MMQWTRKSQLQKKEDDDESHIGDASGHLSNQSNDEIQPMQIAQNEEECDHKEIDVLKNIDPDHDLNLLNISLVTALAVALHNFPEGLVTFVGTLYSPHTGFGIATAIAIHNIPEGISISVPIYYHSGSLQKAFFWAFLAGLSEPIGAIIGYLILDHMFGADAFGWMFGLVGGIMIYISLAELLPVSLKTSCQYPIISCFAGMVVMELSLILFEL